MNKTLRKKKIRRGKKRLMTKKSKIYKRKWRGGGGVIDTYLLDLYKETTVPDFTGCYFKCNETHAQGYYTEKFKRAKVPDENKNLVCTEEEPKPLTGYNPKNYFHTLTATGNQYFNESYEKYFDNKVNDKGGDEIWGKVRSDIINNAKNSTDAQENDDKIIILGPAELLYPFSSVPAKFRALSHGDWTPNVNFNYLIDILCKKGEFFFVVPTGDTNRLIKREKNKYDKPLLSITSDCVKDIVRATLSELLIVRDLENASYVTVKQIGTNYKIPNDYLLKEGYDINVFQVIADKNKLCIDKVFLDMPIDYAK
jgi:hypothetical protein